MNIRSWLVRLYPRPWREHYAEEFNALLEECLHSPLDVVDILFGALDAHLELSNETNWRSMNMNNKLRASILMVFAAYIAFIVAGLSIYGFADDSPFVPMMKTNLVLYASWTTIQAGAVIALLAIVIGGAPLAWTVIRRVFTSQRKDLQLLLVPAYAFFALALYFGSMLYLSFNTTILNPPATSTAHGLMWGLISVFILGALASAAAVWVVVSRTDSGQETFPILGKNTTIKVYEFAFTPAIIATICMVVMFIASIIWFWQAFSARPDLLATHQGPMMTDTRGALAFTLILMASAVVTSCFGLIRGRSSQKMA
jgi:hypothetical protein